MLVDAVTYNLCLLSMGAKGYPKALGLCMHPIPPVVVSRGQTEIETPWENLLVVGRQNRPLGRASG
jgi:hypothetical protein